MSEQSRQYLRQSRPPEFGCPTSAPVPLASYSVRQFCSAHGISRRLLYDLWARGEGPRRKRVGARVLISAEAAAEWRAETEAA